MITIRKAQAEDIHLIREIALESWPVTYHFLEKEQVDYMLDMLYNYDVLQELISSGEQYFIMIEEGGRAHGFAAFSQRPGQTGVFKLNKLYLWPGSKGRGWGRKLIEETEKLVKQSNGHTLELNVNRFNLAKDFYSHLGYEIAYEEDIPIGNYWMNDYVMRKKL